MFKRVYLVGGVLMLLLYSTAAIRGWEMGGSSGRKKDEQIKGLRSSRVGYHGFLWGRYHGGK